MKALSAKDVLAVWEQGQRQHLLDRALTLLAAAYPGVGRRELAALPIGRRDAALLRLHERTFGGRMRGLSRCPACGEQVEFSLRADDVHVEGGTPEGQVESGGVTVRFRAATSLDLAAVAGCSGLGAAREALIRRCVLAAWQGGEDVPTEALGAEVLAAVAAGMEAADPQAEVMMGMCCPGCQHEWGVLLDVLVFLWAEVSAAARGILQDVHALARAYGWSEGEVLALSGQRRRMYLEMVGT